MASKDVAENAKVSYNKWKLQGIKAFATYLLKILAGRLFRKKLPSGRSPDFGRMEELDEEEESPYFFFSRQC